MHNNYTFFGKGITIGYFNPAGLAVSVTNLVAFDVSHNFKDKGKNQSSLIGGITMSNRRISVGGKYIKKLVKNVQQLELFGSNNVVHGGSKTGSKNGVEISTVETLSPSEKWDDNAKI